MSHAYSNLDPNATTVFPDLVLIATSHSKRLINTKRQKRDGSFHAYDNIKHFDFYEREIEDLPSLYRLLGKLIDFPRAALIRAHLKDTNSWKNQERLFKGPDSTLISSEQHWFALDIDGFDVSSGNLRADTEKVLLGLDLVGTECIALASSSYGFKPAIHLRLFFWATDLVSNLSLKKHFYNNKVHADLNLFNPIQLIYVARPLLLGPDSVKQRLIFVSGDYVSADVRPIDPKGQGTPEHYYSKQAALAIYEKYKEELQFAAHGSYHETIFRKGYLIGRFIELGYLEEDEIVEECLEICRYFWKNNDLKKDQNNFEYVFKQGQKSMQETLDMIEKGEF